MCFACKNDMNFRGARGGVWIEGVTFHSYVGSLNSQRDGEEETQIRSHKHPPCRGRVSEKVTVSKSGRGSHGDLNNAFMISDFQLPKLS